MLDGFIWKRVTYEKNLSMKEIESIFDTDTVRVRVMSLAPREAAEWHYHSKVTDDITCLAGAILVRTMEPDEKAQLSPGKRCQIKVRRVHQLENLGDAEASYLLAQGVGKYDFNRASG